MSSHWYLKSGETFYTVERSDGKGIRDTTIRDAKKVGALYSVTTVTGQIRKEMLENWKLKQLMKAVSELPLWGQDESWENYQRRVFNRYLDNTNRYSKQGTEIHNKLEDYFTTYELQEEDMNQLSPAIEAVMSLDYDYLEPELSFASIEGYGGKIDLILRKADGTTAILDFKTKQGDDLNKTLYDDYPMQLAAYRQAIDPTADCYNLFISVTHPGVVRMHRWEEEDLQRGWKMFKSLLDYCKLANKYDPCEFKHE